MRTATTVASSTCLAVVALLVPASAHASVAHKWSNCTVVNQRLPHGVGLAKAHDHTSGTPVTSFRHDSDLYHQAMRANSRLDGDKDGIACERA